MLQEIIALIIGGKNTIFKINVTFRFIVETNVKCNTEVIILNSIVFIVNIFALSLMLMPFKDNEVVY